MHHISLVTTIIITTGTTSNGAG
ncbi:MULTISPECIES: thr operon leader peptide [Dickeya]|uniref:Thr operon leader peptide n=1 Tax=Dickeya undicola TaxID=1577887 RepID=A0A3N0FXI3_9GAMM|nr:thr operon leader peptide [Dickeya solani]NPE51161.1 hypothetical protein [Dickeya dadantii]RNM04877.1 hypothetical protein EF878_15345 [Dickeya undicola]MBJ2337049.1 thr operon leader peptide [Dickeya solani]MBJ2343707.1 thr operon leader peptide [Dickeya solani]